MAHKKGQGSSRNGRDSRPKYLGVKAYAGEFVTTGSIIVRQNGTKFKAGKNVKVARNDSLFALADGTVKFANYKVSVEPVGLKQRLRRSGVSRGLDGMTSGPSGDRAAGFVFLRGYEIGLAARGPEASERGMVSFGKGGAGDGIRPWRPEAVLT